MKTHEALGIIQGQIEQGIIKDSGELAKVCTSFGFGYNGFNMCDKFLQRLLASKKSS